MTLTQNEIEMMTDESTLFVTVDTDDTEQPRGRPGEPPTLVFDSYAGFTDVFNGTTLALLNAIRREQPDSIRDTARATGRDVKNVHDELTTLEALGVIYFEERGAAKRPVVWFDTLEINVPIGIDPDGMTGTAGNASA